MKLFSRIFLVVFSLYAVFMAGLAYVFHNGESYRESIEKMLSHITEQDVTIGNITTTWVNGDPSFLVEDLFIKDDESGQEFGSFSYMSGRVNVFSTLMFWPKFDEFVVESPKLVFESLNDGSFRFAGKPYYSSKSQQRRSFFVLTWLFSQRKADVHNAEFVWRHREGKLTEIKQFSAQYRYQNNQRLLYAVAKHDQEAIGISSIIQGNPLFSDAWDADIKLLSGSDIEHLNKNNFQVIVNSGQGTIESGHLRVQRLADMVNIFGRGSRLEKWMSESKLSGDFYDISLQFSGALISLDSWEFSAKGGNLSSLATNDSPGLDNVRAIFRLNQSNGVFAFSVQETQLDWPKHFLEPINVDALSAKVSLVHDSEQWQFDMRDFLFTNQDIQLTEGSAKLTKKKDKPAYLAFNSTIETDDLAAIEKMFPKKSGIKFRNWWVNAMQPNISVKGDFSYIGDLVPAPLKSGKADLLANLTAKNVILDYGWKRSWPKFIAQEVGVKLSGGGLFFNTNTGKVGEIKALNPKVEIKNIFLKKRVLVLDSNMSGPLSSVVDFLQDGPLIKNKLSEQATKIENAAGNVVGNLQFNMPLNAVKNTKVQGFVNINDGAFSVGQLFDVNSVNGKVAYTESSVSAQDISAKTLGGAAIVNIETLVAAQPPNIRISAVGKADVRRLDGMIGKQLTSRFTGSTGWTALMDFSQKGLDIQVNSTLKGAAINLPEPLFKQKDAKSPLLLKVSTGSKKDNTLSLTIGKSFDLNLRAQSKGSLLDQGVIKVGDIVALKNQNILRDGINIYSQGDINLDDWIDTIKEMSRIPTKQTRKESFVEQLREIDIQSESLTLFDKNLGNVDVLGKSSNGKDWISEISGKNVKGSGVLQPFKSPQKYIFDFDHLYWPAKSDEKLEKVSLNSQQKIEIIDVGSPENYPEVEIKAKDFKVASQPFGSLAFKAKPRNNRWVFEQIEMGSKSLKIVGLGGWKLDHNDQGVTELNLVLKSQEGGQALTDFGFGGFLKDGRAEILLDLFWKGPPASFSLNKLNGSYKLDIQNGSFPKVQADQSKIFGLLNVNALSRRLRLDFGDVFGRGLLFDQMESNGTVSNGEILLDQFYIFSPAVYIEALGKVNLVQENYDMQILVSPQLGGNVALLTALSNPAAGAVVWLVDKVLKGKLNKAIVYTYNVDGPWTKPQVVQQVSNDQPTSIELN